MGTSDVPSATRRRSSSPIVLADSSIVVDGFRFEALSVGAVSQMPHAPSMKAMKVESMRGRSSGQMVGGPS